MTEKEPAKKRTRTGSAPRTIKKAPSTAATKAPPGAPVEAPSERAPTTATTKAPPRAPVEAPPERAPATATPKAPPRASVEAPPEKAPTAATTKAPPRAPVEAPPGQCFWVNQGPILKNLRELCDALANAVSDEQFAHHVTEERNDFAAWVEVVLRDPDCAEALRRTHTRVGAARALKKYIES